MTTQWLSEELKSVKDAVQGSRRWTSNSFHGKVVALYYGMGGYSVDEYDLFIVLKILGAKAVVYGGEEFDYLLLPNDVTPGSLTGPGAAAGFERLRWERDVAAALEWCTAPRYGWIDAVLYPTTVYPIPT